MAHTSLFVVGSRPGPFSKFTVISAPRYNCEFSQSEPGLKWERSSDNARCDRAVKGAALFALKKRPARGALKIQMLSYGEAVLFYFVDLDDVILCCKTHYGQESAAQTFFPI